MRELLYGVIGDPSDCSASSTNPTPDYDPGPTYEIPVVVHIIMNDACTTGVISDEMVESQIEILNEDFLAIPGTNGENGTDMQIRFVLATEDPDGNPATGITRSCNTTWFNDGGSYWNTLAWDPHRYMNLYTNTAGGNLGYVPFLPADAGGVFVGQPNDRVVVHWASFGRDSPGWPGQYDQGRTGTHEVGHYLGLEHTFNASGGCPNASPPACYSNGDLICDTAVESAPRFGCPGGAQSCGSLDPIDNYMDYSDDLCMEMFTLEQSRRQRCTLLNYRPNLYRIVDGPALGFAPSSLDFGDVEVGTPSTPMIALLQNTGTEAATGVVFDLPGGDYDVDTSDCGPTLDAEDACEVTVVWTPSADGPGAATVDVTSDEGPSALLGLQGNGLGPAPELAFSPASLGFGDVPVGTASSPQAALLQNTGTAAATTLAFGTPGGGFVVDSSSCGTSLDAEDECEVTVTFTPVDLGASTAVFEVDSAEGASAALDLQGTGVEAPTPVLGFEPSSVDCGKVELGDGGEPLPCDQVTLSNSGEDATGLSFSVPGSGFTADTSECGDSLDSGTACVVHISFTPLELGPANAELHVESAEEAGATLELAGFGLGETEVFTAIALDVDEEAMTSDGNRVLEPGELVAVAPSWRNEGVAPHDLQGTASELTGPAGASYLLLQTEADYGVVEPGASASCDAIGVCYEIGVGEPAVRLAAHWTASFEEALSEGTAKTWTLHIGDSFVDVPRSSPFYRSIETLLHHEVTGGCGDTEYCPTAGNTRGQMPVFLLRALVGAAFIPEACTPGEELFADVPAASGLCPWIEELANRGVTGGCGENVYCPDAPVNRQQMAIFLLRTLEGEDYTPPACSGSFGDVPCTSVFAPWVEELARRGVTGGCSVDPPLYCPTATVNRQQMAVFVAGVFELTLYGP